MARPNYGLEPRFSTIKLSKTAKMPSQMSLKTLKKMKVHIKKMQDYKQQSMQNELASASTNILPSIDKPSNSSVQLMPNNSVRREMHTQIRQVERSIYYDKLQRKLKQNPTVASLEIPLRSKPTFDNSSVSKQTVESPLFSSFKANETNQRGESPEDLVKRN